MYIAAAVAAAGAVIGILSFPHLLEDNLGIFDLFIHTAFHCMEILLGPIGCGGAATL